jgi:hypothetical protein
MTTVTHQTRPKTLHHGPDTFKYEDVIQRRKLAWLFEHLFLRYGAGSALFRPLIKLRCYNAIAWVTIGLGIIAWIILLWYLRTHFPESD